MKEMSLNQKSIFTLLLNTLKTLALPILVYFGLAMFKPEIFLKIDTIIMTLNQSLLYFAIGWAMLFGMSVNLFDFSVGARLILGSLIGVYFGQKFGLVGFIGGCVISSLIMGILTGMVYSFLKIPSIITGFAMLLIFESLSVLLVKQMKMIVDSTHLFFGKAPYNFILVGLLFICIYITFNKTKFGYQIKAIGGNEQIAQNMGINSAKLKWLTYIIGGAFLSVATVLFISYQSSLQPVVNMASMAKSFAPMMGVMLGLSIKSCNPVIGVAIGELTITIVSTGLVSLDIDSRLQNVVVGGFLLIFLSIQLNKSRVLNFWKQRQVT